MPACRFSSADYYDHDKDWAPKPGSKQPPIGIGAGSHIRKAIVDKNAKVGTNVKVGVSERWIVMGGHVSVYQPFKYTAIVAAPCEPCNEHRKCCAATPDLTG